jgi:hypothetical protein
MRQIVEPPAPSSAPATDPAPIELDDFDPTVRGNVIDPRAPTLPATEVPASAAQRLFAERAVVERRRALGQWDVSTRPVQMRDHVDSKMMELRESRPPAIRAPVIVPLPVVLPVAATAIAKAAAPPVVRVVAQPIPRAIAPANTKAVPPAVPQTQSVPPVAKAVWLPVVKPAASQAATPVAPPVAKVAPPRNASSSDSNPGRVRRIVVRSFGVLLILSLFGGIGFLVHERDPDLSRTRASFVSFVQTLVR